MSSFRHADILTLGMYPSGSAHHACALGLQESRRQTSPAGRIRIRFTHVAIHTTFRRSLAICALVALYAAFMLMTNHQLTFLDDEGTIVTTANIPTVDRLGFFVKGTGEHLHPPLSDILLHEWLRITHHSFQWLRCFSLIFYIAGLLALVRCARLMGNITTTWAVLLLGMLWPFGYFYARITGWYACSFFLIAAVTYCYQLLLQQSSWRRWTAFTITAILLLWTNYFGLAVLGLLAADLLIFHRRIVRANIRPLLCSIVAIWICFLPLIRALSAGAHSPVKSPPATWAAAVMKLGFMLYVVLASVAVAPWFFPWSIPIALGALVLLVVIVRQTQSRLYLLYYVLLLLGLQQQGLLDLKRLLFISPWLLLSIALACSSANRRQAMTATIAVGVIFCIGWLGIATGRHRATSNFYEPWAVVAAQTAIDARKGSVIISDSTPYFFYLNYALGLEAVPRGGTYLGEANYQRLAAVSVFNENLDPRLAPSFPSVTLVSGVDLEPAMLKQAAILAALASSCRLLSERHSTPDPALDYKRIIDPKASLVNYRVSVRRFDCSHSHPLPAENQPAN